MVCLFSLFLIIPKFNIMIVLHLRIDCNRSYNYRQGTSTCIEYNSCGNKYYHVIQ